MALSNYGTGIIADSNGGVIGNLKLSNVNIQDNTIYTVTSLKDGSDTNGDIVLTKINGCIVDFESRHTILCKSTYILNGSVNDLPINNLHINLKDVKFVTKSPVVSELITPMKGNEQTQIHFKGNGCTWNSKHPDTELIGSTLFFEAGGDGHLGKHKDAVIKDVKLLWKSTVRNEFVLGMQQNWDSTDKPSPMPGLKFTSMLGNDYISFFTWNQVETPAGINNAFLVNPDWCYNVALPGTKPNSIRRSYRRNDFTTDDNSYWKGIIINPTYLWIDPYTTIDNNGIEVKDKTYLTSINYNTPSTDTTDKASDIITMRFSPTVQEKEGNKIPNVNISVLNNSNANMIFDSIGNTNDKLSALGFTDLNGRIIIQEHTVKNYDDTTTYITDSIVLKNRSANKYHKWWEEGTKLIIVHDTRNTTGKNAAITYNNFSIAFRKPGYIFELENYNFEQPYIENKKLLADNIYNFNATNLLLSVTYDKNTGITTITLPDGIVTLDEIYKAIIDTHYHIDNTKIQTLLPVTQNTKDTLVLNNNINLEFKTNTKINKGTLIKKLEFKSNDLTPYINNLYIPYIDINGMYFNITCNTNFSIYGEIINSVNNNVISVIEFESGINNKSINLKDNEHIDCLISGFGYVSKRFILDKDSNFELFLEKESLLDTNFTIEYLETIKSYFRTVIDGPNTYGVEVMNDMSDFTDREFLAGFAWWIFKYGDLVSMIKLNLLRNNVLIDIFTYGEGTIIINIPGFIVRVTNDITENRDDGYYIPIIIIDGGDFKSVKLNQHGINLITPRYTKHSVNFDTTVLNTLKGTLETTISNNTVINTLHEKIESVAISPEILDELVTSVNKIKVTSKKALGGKLN